MNPFQTSTFSIPEPAADPRIGTQLGKYHLTSRLGQGGMGVVYAAWDTRLRRSVAVKLLSGAIANDPDALARFEHEAQAAARLNHPNVVAVYDIDRQGSDHFLVMELVAGGSAQDFLKTQGRFAWQEATEIVAQACRGLVAAHAVGVIHRDIKPGNLVRAADGAVKLADFGLAKALDAAASVPMAGILIGTPSYMSPEQCRFDAIDERSDLYSLGATYFALLTGRPPFPGDLPVQVMFAHCSQPIPDPRAMDDQIPAACAEIVLHSLAKLPHDRFDTAAVMLAALESLAPAKSIVAQRPSEWSNYARTRKFSEGPLRAQSASQRAAMRRRRVAAVTLSLLMLLATLVAAVWDPWKNTVPSGNSSDLTMLGEIGPHDSNVREDDELLRTAAYEATSSGDLVRMRDVLQRLTRHSAALGEGESTWKKTIAALSKAIEFRAQITEQGFAIPLDMVVSYLTISPSGRWLAATGNAGDSRVVVHNLVTGERRADTPLRVYGRSQRTEVTSLLFSLDSASLFAVANMDQESKVLRWNMPFLRSAPPAQTSPVQHANALALVAPNDGILVATESDGAAVVMRWDLASDRVTALPNATMPSIHAMTATITESPLIALAAADGTVRIYDLKREEWRAPLKTPFHEPAIAFSPNGRQLAVTGKRYVQIWDVESNKSAKLIQIPGGEATCAFFSSDSRWLVTGGGTEIGGVVTLWDASTYAELQTFRGHTAAVRAVSVSHDGWMIASGSDDQTVRLWDASRWMATPAASTP